MSDGVRGRLDWIEAGRGIAACLVMASHLYVVRPIPIDTALTDELGNVGVGFFFVLSGFIMVHIHGDDIDRPDQAARFAWRRLIRIWPTYWLVLAIAFAVNQLQRPAMRVHPDLGWLLRQLSIWPGAPPFVGPAWTLRHELLFYSLFVTLLLSQRAGLILFALWIAAIGSRFAIDGLPGGLDVPWDVLLLHPLNLFFPVGMALAWAVRRGWGGSFVVGSAVIGLVLLALSEMGLGLFGAAFVYAAILGGLVMLSKGGWKPGPGWVWLGAISYSLYLLHLSIFTLLRGAIGHVSALDAVWPLRVVAQMGMAIGAAGLLHAIFERPLLRRLSARDRVLGFRVGRPEPSIEVAARQ